VAGNLLLTDKGRNQEMEFSIKKASSFTKAYSIRVREMALECLKFTTVLERLRSILDNLWMAISMGKVSRLIKVGCIIRESGKITKGMD